MNRRDFLASAVALAAGPSIGGCACLRAEKPGRILFGACAGADAHVALLKAAGYDFFEMPVAVALDPAKDAE